MASEKLKAGVAMDAAVANPGAEVVGAPRFTGDFECWDRGPDGAPVVLWREKFGNVVTAQGRAHIINRLFGSGTASSAGMFLALHSATTASNNVWSQISGSQVISYGNNMPLITFLSKTETSFSDVSFSASASYGFTASTQTVSGAAVLFYTTNTCSTNAAESQIRMYAYGTFNASQQVQNGNTLSATVTVSYA